MLPVVVVGAILWSFGIPIYALHELRAHRNDLEKATTKDRLGFLYNGYRPDNYYWESYVMFRKVLVVIVATFVSIQGKTVQALVVFIILIMALALNNRVKPFSSKSLNETENLSLITSMLSVYCGLQYVNAKEVTDSNYSDGDLVLSDTTKVILYLTIILCNAFFFVFLVYQVFFESKEFIQLKCPTVHMIVFNCCSKK